MLAWLRPPHIAPSPTSPPHKPALPVKIQSLSFLQMWHAQCDNKSGVCIQYLGVHTIMPVNSQCHASHAVTVVKAEVVILACRQCSGVLVSELCAATEAA